MTIPKRMFFLLCTMLSIVLLTCPVNSSAQIGDPAPNFTVTDTDGNPHTLYDYLDAGKTVVLDFFYTTCIPCQFYNPQVNLAYEKYGCNEGEVFFMSIDYNDTNQEVEAYDEEYEIPYPSVSGTQGGGNAVVSLYSIIGFPTFYVIDSTRKIVEVIDPPTLQVFDYRFQQLGISPADCNPTGIEKINSNQAISILPNPIVDNGVRVYIQEVGSEKMEFQIYDVTGRMVSSGSMNMDGSNTCEIDVTGFPAGLFLVKMIDPAGAKLFSGTFLKL